MKFLKNLNWANIATPAVVSLLMIGLAYPFIKPLLRIFRSPRSQTGRKKISSCLAAPFVQQFPRQWSLPSRTGKPPDRFSADDSYE